MTTDASDAAGLIFALDLDGAGSAERVGWDGIRRWQREGAPRPHTAPGHTLWIHLDRFSDPAKAWVNTESGLDELVCDALLAEHTRPRQTRIDTGLLMILRGVNLNPGADPDDMISLRLWAEPATGVRPARVISLRGPRVMAVHDIREWLDRGDGPRSTGDLVTWLAERLAWRMAPALEDLHERVDDLEEEIEVNADDAAWHEGARDRLRTGRRQAIVLRRYIAPQGVMLADLAKAELPWLDANNRAVLRETSNRLAKHTEDLESIRERSVVLSEELTSIEQARLNNRVYALTILAGIFLPLGFITGLFGINVGGMPGIDSRWGFLVICGICLVFVTIQLYVFRRMGWVTLGLPKRRPPKDE